MRVHGGNEDRHIGPGGGSGDVITVVKIVYSLYITSSTQEYWWWQWRCDNGDSDRPVAPMSKLFSQLKIAIMH